MQFHSLALIAPHLFNGILSSDKCETVRIYSEIVFLVFSPETSREDVAQIDSLVRQLVPRIVKLRREHPGKFKIADNSLHRLLHIAGSLRMYGSARNISVQRQEAKHKTAKTDLASTTKRVMNRALMEREGFRVAMRSAVHGLRWDDQGRPALDGHAAGKGWRLLSDPRDECMAHPILRRLTRYTPHEGRALSKWLWDARAQRDKGRPFVTIDADELKRMHAVYELGGRRVPQQRMSPSAERAVSATIGDQTYRAGDDVIVQFEDPDTQRRYPWYARVVELLVHEVPTVDASPQHAVWFRVRLFSEVLVARSPFRSKPWQRRIVALQPQPHAELISAAMINSPVGVFHYCRLADGVGELKQAPADSKRAPAATVTFSSESALNRHGGHCGLATVALCAEHGLRCAKLACAPKLKRVQRFVHDFSRNLYSIEDRWTGHG